MTSLELLLCVVLISISAYMSASEIALFSLSRFQLRSVKDSFRNIYRKIKRLLSDPSGLLITILVINEVLNISLSALIAKIIARNPIPVPENLSYLPTWAFQTILGIVITTPVILFFCEITPKVIGAKANQLVSSLTASPLIIIYDLLKPLRFLLTATIHLISKNSVRIESSLSENGTDQNKKETKETILKESDFLLMVEEAHKEGSIQESELELIRNVFELDRTTVADVATPLSQVLSLPVQMTLKGALVTMRSQKFSRIPVVGNGKKEVVGILYAKDLLNSKFQGESTASSVATLMRKPFFVNPSMKLNSLFRKFKQQKIHMAIVKNSQNGEMIGVVTMSDVLEALFEDLYSEGEEFSQDKRNKPRGSAT